ncbi:MAG: Lrp/AsnC family transcriptional regulator [Syntrophomonadaceae bacterium]|nr:Lrp/AsnC family transcriptional regulator [Syntrophomonadaceae bacterium]
MDRVDARILNYLQEGISLSPRPFLDMARELGISEETVLARIEALRNQGLIRRLGGVFDSPRMGMKSTLCAMEVPEARIEEVAQKVNAYREVTHNYLRDDVYNMWFTVTASSQEDLERILQEIEADTGIAVVSMPVRRRFKIKVAFALDEQT